MDIEKKIQILRACSSKKGNRCSSCPAFGKGDRNCLQNTMRDAATALSTLQAENEQLREKIEDARLEGYAKGLGEMSEENERLRAKLEQVKNERDSLRATLHWMNLNGQKED